MLCSVKLFIAVTALVLLLGASSLAQASPVEGAETVVVTYGADANPTGDPIGGGAGYSNIITTWDCTVTTKAEFLSAMTSATSGQVIYISPAASIDLSGESDVAIPVGVTVASNRGEEGSLGGLIYTNTQTSGFAVLLQPQSHVTFNGIRLEGPDGSTSGTSYMKGICTDGYHGIEIENCEIYNWPYAGVAVYDDNLGADGLSSPDLNHIHHNYIHDCQRNGYGYGVDVAAASALIEANVFDYCRHDVAGQRSLPDAATTNYEVSYNIFETHINNNSLVDCHGGNDSKAWGNPNNPDVNTAAGGTLLIHHNTFKVANQPSVAIRGVPAVVCKVYNNWTYVATVSTGPTATAFKQRLDNLIGAVLGVKTITSRGYVRMEVFDNWYGTAAPPRVSEHNAAGASETPTWVSVAIVLAVLGVGGGAAYFKLRKPVR
jgi:hypothetical protein